MEYQYYEFIRLDSPLSFQEQQVIRSWSSRAEVTAHRAVFSYSYSDFPQDEAHVLERYFDVMIYYANWGEKRVMLKVPLELVDYDQLQLFEVAPDSCSEVMLTLTRERKYALIDFHENKDEGYEDWFEETSLIGLTPIRSAIIQGDYRALGLFWLYAMSTVDITNLDQPAPPVPPNFHQKDAALAAMMDFWNIDPILILDKIS